nr:immunoglobulin heavy chain junction region [Mus musculus]
CTLPIYYYGSRYYFDYW